MVGLERRRYATLRGDSEFFEAAVYKFRSNVKIYPKIYFR